MREGGINCSEREVREKREEMTSVEKVIRQSIRARKCQSVVVVRFVWNVRWAPKSDERYALFRE